VLKLSDLSSDLISSLLMSCGIPLMTILRERSSERLNV